MSSKRGYVSQAELAEYANITITDTTEADDQISIAEELLDQYVGYQKKAVCHEYVGLAQSGTTTTFVLAQDQLTSFDTDFLKYCMVEIIDGTGEGQRRRITANVKNTGVVTTEAFTVALDNTSFYKIWQLGKFPRVNDAYYYSLAEPQKWRKSIPEMVKRATAAQVEFIRAMGVEYFKTQQASLQSEQIGDYSYQKGANAPSGFESLIAPKAMTYLRGITNRTGEITI